MGYCVMKHERLALDSEFDVAFARRDVQAAQMVLAPGTNTGGPDNRHAGADQWLFVVSGTGLAVIDGERQALQAGSLLLIERGEAHEIRCTGTEPLRTVNFYSPPAYADNGDHCRQAMADTHFGQHERLAALARANNEKVSRTVSWGGGT